jgi:DNA-binding response OmpR family regulator
LVLLVEDNPADAGLVRKALEEHGIEGDLVVVADGETAIQLAEDLDAQLMECPNLAIIDLNLPRKSGRAVLERFRRSELCRAIPVVILSSSDAVQDRTDSERLGADRYFRKPSTLDEFLSLGATFKATMALRR